MIRIEGEKPALYQWDLNRRVELFNTKPGVEVHFVCSYFANGDCLCRRSYEEDGKVFANIPNILLQNSGIIAAYVYVHEDNKAYTEYRAEILVLPRPKPADYVYAETEVLTWRALDERIIMLEKAYGDISQFDWNQNDSAAVGYIKNRPFYEEGEVVIVEEQTATTEDDGDAICAEITAAGKLEAGKTYSVEFNGAFYSCIAYHPTEDGNELEYVLIGDIRRTGGWFLFCDEAGKGEPFAFVQDGNNFWLMTEAGGTYTFKVTCAGGVVIEPAYEEAIKSILPTVEMTATFEEGTTATYKLFGEVVKQ